MQGHAASSGDKGLTRSKADRQCADICSFLQTTSLWEGNVAPVLIETHTSFLFLGGQRVLKLKKPVKLPYLDFRTLQARHWACSEELRLNRELAGKVYRGIIPVTRQSNGRFALGGSGPVADWLVDMCRLPEAQMLDIRLTHGPEPIESEIASVCNVMTAFYLGRSTPADAGERYVARWLREARINAKHLAGHKEAIGPEYDQTLSRAAITALETCRPEILQRGALGLIVEGHGDLRPEHVNLGNPPIIFDRLEFDADLRLADPFEELNYLGVGCDMLGAPWIRAVLLSRLRLSGIRAPSPELLNAYRLNRLLTRARLAIDHLNDPHIRTPEKWPGQARDCLKAARRLVRAA